MNQQCTRILYVDDDEGDFLLLEELVAETNQATRAMGFCLQLDWVISSQEAITLMKENQHDIYLLDYRLGPDSGLDLLRTAINIGCNNPIIILTGQGDRDVDLEAMQAGAADFLVKGQLTAPLLERSIRYAVRHKQAEQALREKEEHLMRLALYDALTGLPNRYLLEEHLEQRLAEAALRQQSIGLIFLDLYRFNDINDTLGHSIGDELLKAVARRLTQIVDQQQTGITISLLARLGGDEFALVVSDFGPLDQTFDPSQSILVLISELLEEIHIPFQVAEHELFVGLHVGYSLFPDHAQDVRGLLSNTDNALDSAKASSSVRHYETMMNTQSVDRLRLTNRLRRAAELGELLLFYQPQVDLRKRRVISVEALIRWKHPSLGLISPDRFVPLAEKSGLINPIGDWILQKAFDQFAEWQRDPQISSISGETSSFRISLNISPIQFAQSDFVERIIRPLAFSGIEPHQVIIEVTESVFMRDIYETDRRLQQLREMGMTVHIDDFGKAYSSLSYLRTLPVDGIKIDRMFIQDMTHQENPSESVLRRTPSDPKALVEAIIKLGHGLNLGVIAEGVETTDQLKSLYELGCDQVQGYIFSAPLPSERLWAVIDQIHNKEWFTSWPS